MESFTSSFYRRQWWPSSPRVLNRIGGTTNGAYHHGTPPRRLSIGSPLWHGGAASCGSRNEQGIDVVRHRLTPRSGATQRTRLFPTAAAVGYYLSPFGLGGGTGDER